MLVSLPFRKVQNPTTGIQTLLLSTSANHLGLVRARSHPIYGAGVMRGLGFTLEVRHPAAAK